jgi:drug/metabolite transporter (DMT)-like permease
MTSSGIVALATAYFVDPIVTSIQAIDATTAAAITYSVVIGNVISYNVYGYFLKTFSLTLVSLFGFVIPLTVTVIGWLFLGEVITKTFLAAAAVTLVGLAVFYADEIKKDLLTQK